MTEEEYDQAIQDAWDEAEALELRGESLLAEADEWYDEAFKLTLERNKLRKPDGVLHVVGQMELDY